MKTLGISALHHDSAVCYTKNNEILFASGEERFSRIKNDSSWPKHSIDYAIEHFGKPDNFVFYDKLSFSKRREIKSKLGKNVWFIDHHESHAYSSIFTAPWDTRHPCAVMVVDTVGANKSTSLGYWDGKNINWLKVFRHPNSLGLFYSSITRLIGYEPNLDESKTMSAAAFGNPKWLPYMEKYFLEYDFSSYQCLKDFRRGLGQGVLDFDIAASAQLLLQEILITLAAWLQKETKCDKLTYAGGVALNCVANTKIFEETNFTEMWVQPAAGDAGGAMGAAFGERVLHPRVLCGPPAQWKNAYLGCDAGDNLDPAETAKKLIKGQIVPVLRGKAEWGPRALGNRSFLAVPNKINSIRLHDIKGRQTDRWRPWAPICLSSVANNYFEIANPSYEMMFVAYSKTKQWFKYPDNTARLQVVDSVNNPWLAEVLRITTENGKPILINTSLNVKGKPIVNTYEDYEKEIKNVFEKIAN
jgi:carbamoyltransferase